MFCSVFVDPGHGFRGESECLPEISGFTGHIDAVEPMFLVPGCLYPDCYEVCCGYDEYDHECFEDFFILWFNCVHLGFFLKNDVR